jgi:DNA-directed RNA polymerase subunit RPC12/RpoP
MARQGQLFDKPPPTPRRILAHVEDAGQDMAFFVCHRCGWADWLRARTVSEAKRGVPCPTCNSTDDLQK